MSASWSSAARLPFNARPWRAVVYVVAQLGLPLAGALAVGLSAAAGGWVGLVAVGLPFLAAYVLVAVAASGVARRLVRLLGRPAIADPHREPDRSDPRAWIAARKGEPATARELVHALLAAALAPLDVVVLATWTLGSAALLAAPALIASGPVSAGPWTIGTTAEAWVAFGAGVVTVLAGMFAVVALAALHAGLAGALLSPRGDELRAQVTELTRSRLRLIDAFDVERRRIERDLHDGAQAQLAALTMTLDVARIELEDGDAAAAARLVDDAHAQATRTLVELRDLIHEVHPPILVDRGLAAALGQLADRSAIPVARAVDVPVRLPASVETAAYFVASEAVANAAKHSGAATVSIAAQLAGDLLVLTIRDDGRGGADAGRGSGLLGLGDRVAAVGGRLTLSSPPGGPTVVRAEIPLPLERGGRR